jgi:DNA polymerase-3 subunit alpha
MIEKMGFSSYFLIVCDFINYAKSKDIPVGPGRGSAAGSLVAYGLDITDIDPIKYGLLFERFLNPERVSMPDIDVDFCMDRRSEVIDYVADRYGKDHVAQIITFGTMHPRRYQGCRQGNEHSLL